MQTLLYKNALCTGRYCDTGITFGAPKKCDLLHYTLTKKHESHVAASVPSRIFTRLVRICPNDKVIEIFALQFHYFEDPFCKFFALNLHFQDTSYSLALKYLSFLFKFVSFAFYNINLPVMCFYAAIFHFARMLID